jgi:hypothetical protein
MNILMYSDCRAKQYWFQNSEKYYLDRLRADGFNIDLRVNNPYPDGKHVSRDVDLIRDLIQNKIVSAKDYDVVILQSTEDWASHPRTTQEQRYSEPHVKSTYDFVFGDKLQEYLKCENPVPHHSFANRHKLHPMYSLEMLETQLIPMLQTIPNLLWIGSNKWAANWKGRIVERLTPEGHKELCRIRDHCKIPERNWLDPNNHTPMFWGDVALPYAESFERHLSHTIGYLDWSDSEIKARTFDQIHYTDEGYDYVYSKIKQKLKSTKWEK